MLRHVTCTCLRLRSLGQSYTRKTAQLVLSSCRFQCGLVGPRGSAKEAEDQDVLLNQLKYANSPEQLIGVVDSHHQVMNLRHLKECLTSLYHIQRKVGAKWEGKREYRSTGIKDIPGFKEMCAMLQKKARLLEPSDLLNSLKTVLLCGVEANSSLVQTLLQLIRHHVNQLTVQEVEYLHFLLSRIATRGGPLREALLMALPVVFEAQLAAQLPDASTSSLPSLLTFASQTCPKVVPQILEEAGSRGLDMDHEQALSCLWSLITLKGDHNKGSDKLIGICMEKVCSSIHLLSDQRAGALLNALSRRISFGDSPLYYEPLFESAGDVAVSSRWGVGPASRMLRYLTKAGHVHEALTDYLATAILENAESESEDSLSWGLCSLVSGCALDLHTPPRWDEVRQLILNQTFWRKDFAELPLIRFALDLLTLDIVVKDLLDVVLSPEYLGRTFGSGVRMFHYFQLLRIHQTLSSTHKAGYDGPLLPDPYLSTALRVHGEEEGQEFPLEGALHVGLGGGNYVKSRVFTKMGHFLDHLVVMRKGGYPIAINTDASSSPSHGKEYVEDLQLPGDSVTLAVKLLKPSGYPLNSNSPKGMLLLEMRDLEAIGFAPVLISQAAWEALLHHERVPYLMAKLRDRCTEAEQQSQGQAGSLLYP